MAIILFSFPPSSFFLFATPLSTPLAFLFSIQSKHMASCMHRFKLSTAIQFMCFGHDGPTSHLRVVESDSGIEEEEPRLEGGMLIFRT